MVGVGLEAIKAIGRSGRHKVYRSVGQTEIEGEETVQKAYGHLHLRGSPRHGGCRSGVVLVGRADLRPISVHGGYRSGRDKTISRS